MVLRRIPLFILFFTVTMLSAQVNSPYSRYGLGNVFPTTFGAANGMAGISAAYFSQYNINYQNPASYSDIAYATFDAGAYGNIIKLQDGDESFTSGDGNLSYLAFGFPMLKKLRNHGFGLSFGLIPYSAFEYNIIEEIPTDDPTLGTIEYNYVGDGKLYQIYGGLGYKYETDAKPKATDTTIDILNVFSVGANAASLFGSLYNITYASFPDQVGSQTTKLTYDSRINGGIGNMGIGITRQYVKKYKEEKTSQRDYKILRLGGAYTPSINVNGTQSVVWTNIFRTGNYEVITDTLYIVPDTSGSIKLPSSFQAGFLFSMLSTDVEDKNSFMLSAQYSRTNWSEYSGFQDAGVLGDSWRATIGGEVNTKQRINKAQTKTEDQKVVLYNHAPLVFRFGLYTGQSNLIIDGEQLSDRGITAGIGIPVGIGNGAQPNFAYSKINLFVNAGQRGSNIGINETYYNFGVSFSLVDLQWFTDYKLN
jgi:hypothetical protein